MAPAHLFQSAFLLSDLERFYRQVRHASERLGEPVSDADARTPSGSSSWTTGGYSKPVL